MPAWVTLDAVRGVAHLPRPGDRPDGTTGAPGAMCGAQLGPLLGMAPVEGAMDLVAFDDRWRWCTSCYPRGGPQNRL